MIPAREFSLLSDPPPIFDDVMKLLTLWVFVVLLGASSTALRAATPEAVSALDGLWKVMVQGETRTRTLQLRSSSAPASGSVDAMYNWSDELLLPATAEIRQQASGLSLSVTTPAKSVLKASGPAQGPLRGSISYTDGQTKTVTLERLADDALAAGGSAVPFSGERPQMEVGDSWAYRRTERNGDTLFYVQRVVRRRDEEIEMTSGSEYLTYTRDLNLKQIKRGNRVYATYTPYFPSYDFPLGVGKQWRRAFEGIVDDRDENRWAWEGRVEAIETIMVPAGRFETFRIVLSGTYTGVISGMGTSYTAHRNETIWYAPAVKRNVKGAVTFTSRGYYDTYGYELLSYRLQSH